MESTCPCLRGQISQCALHLDVGLIGQCHRDVGSVLSIGPRHGGSVCHLTRGQDQIGPHQLGGAMLVSIVIRFVEITCFALIAPPLPKAHTFVINLRMLLRSSSAPILNSWLPHSKEPSSSSDPEFQSLQRTKSVTVTSSFHSTDQDHTNKPIISNTTPPLKTKNNIPLVPSNNDHRRKKEKAVKPSTRIERLFSSSGLQERMVTRDEEEPGGIGSGGGRKIHGGGGGNSGSEFYGSDSTDAYYQKMIEANPDNPLLLGNYATFLKDVRGDLARAEDFYGRAILENPCDGNMLSLYADLIWQSQKDAQRAESYFDRAVQNAPDDCYIQASYARFLWDAEEEEDQE